jgi:hypothetical protein
MNGHALVAQQSHSRCTIPATLESGARAQGSRVGGRSRDDAERLSGGVERPGAGAQKVAR